MERRFAVLAMGAFAVAVVGGTAMAASDPVAKCQSAKLKAAGKGISGELGCASKAKKKAIPTDPNCIAKVQAKTAKALDKADGACPGSTAAIQTQITNCVNTLLADVPGDGKCPSSSAKVVGKSGAAELACEAKEVTKPGSFTACDAKEDSKLQSGLTKAGSCGQASFATINGDIDTCDTSIKGVVVPGTTTSTVATTSSTVATTTTSSTILSSTTTSTTTTTTVGGGCNCCSNTRMSFTTAQPSSSATGSVLDDSGANVINLTAGGLYFGGGLDGVPLPAAVPSQGNTLTAITGCDSATGALTIGALTSAQTGSNANCSATGCLFGPPLPIPNPSSPATSTCVVNVVSSDATGTGNCDGNIASLNLPLSSGIYLTGDVDPITPGIQPCPVCLGGTCHGGTNTGLACTPGTTTTGDAYPTSNDCPPAAANFLGNLPIGFNLTTGTQTKTAFDNLPTQSNVFCGFCATNAGVFENPSHQCTTNTDCTTGTFTNCRQRSSGAFATDANALNTARTISETGSPSACLADGATHDATLVSIFCIPPTYNGLVDGSADLPGPGAVSLPGTSQLLP